MILRRDFIAATTLAGLWPTLASAQSIETTRVLCGFPADKFNRA